MASRGVIDETLHTNIGDVVADDSVSSLDGWESLSHTVAREDGAPGIRDGSAAMAIPDTK